MKSTRLHVHVAIKKLAGVYHKLFVSTLLVTALLGCSKLPINDYSHYADRLASVLEVDFNTKTRKFTAPQPPIWSNQKTATLDINIIEFLSLSHCDLQYIIGEKNSGLGKHASASQQLINTLRFLESAPRCIDILKNNQQHPLASKLSDAVNIKSQLLVHSIGVAILQSPEINAFWRQPPPKDYPFDINTDIIQALRYLNMSTKQWLSGNYQVDSGQFEQALFTLKHADGGALWDELTHLSSTLADANHIIDARLGTNPLCRRGLKTNNFRYFNNVVQNYFIEDIQKKAAVSIPRAKQLFGELDMLEEQLKKAETASYKKWRTARNHQLTNVYNSPKNHVKKVKQLWQQCGHSH